ncbi:MAG: transcription termination factor NusA [Clostridia bacterium]|nr:transcription termination factor NusA [Clostridia bacterium]
MNKDFIDALNQLEREKGISKDDILEAFEASLTSAFKKQFTQFNQFRVVVDRESGTPHFYIAQQIVEVPEDQYNEFPLEYAKQINPEYKVGDIFEQEFSPLSGDENMSSRGKQIKGMFEEFFERNAVQQAKQVLTQHLKEAKRKVVYKEFQEKQGTIVNGTVEKVLPAKNGQKRSVIVRLDETTALLPPKEQVPGETYREGERIKVFVMDVKKDKDKEAQIFVSRSHPGLVKGLFEREIPEIAEGVVEIMGIAREAGSRTKIAVYSSDETVDPIGSCVGERGMRIDAIVDELGGEKIDVINWNADPEIMISNVLSPSDVEKVVILDEDAAEAMAVVPDYQLSLAIGKEGQNVRLAAKVSGWKIDIKSHSQFFGSDEETEEVVEETDFIEL